MEKVDIFNSFLTANKLHGKCIGVVKKGCMNIFDVQIENDFRLSKFSALSKELMLSLKSFSVPSTKFKLESGLLQVETVVVKVPTSDLIENLSTIECSSCELPVILGTSLQGESVSIDVNKNPHMLVGGSTGSGKSTLLHTIISNLLLTTKSNIYIVDTKAIEFARYADLTSRVQITDKFSDFRNLLLYLIDVMENRYFLLKQYPDLDIINNELFKPIVLIIDEFADLTMQDSDKECYILLCRLIQKCRAAGIYCILATQRPSVDIITGVIKANFPARIACKVSSKIDSRIILDQNGAESITNIGEAIINNYKYAFEKFQVSYAPIGDIINLLNEKMAPNT